MAYIPIYQVRINPETQKPFMGEDGFEIVDLIGHTFVMDEQIPELPPQQDEEGMMHMKEIARLQAEYQKLEENP